MTTQEWLNFGLAAAALLLHSPKAAPFIRAVVQALRQPSGKGM